jgi:hypothetical protein
MFNRAKEHILSHGKLSLGDQITAKNSLEETEEHGKKLLQASEIGVFTFISITCLQQSFLLYLKQASPGVLHEGSLQNFTA